ncbi:MAG: hypothetical protein AAGF94_19795 [Pseudomonadota bacterium]
MLALHDIVDITGLTIDEVEAIAEHESIPRVSAAALGQYMLASHRGETRVHEMICDDIRDALHKQDLVHARDLYATLKHFLAEHPGADHGAH